MQDICSLVENHEALDALADRLIRIARPGRGSVEECHLLLRSLDCQLQAHQAAEVRVLATVSRMGLCDSLWTELRALREEFADLTEGWMSYLARWTQMAIAAERADFSQETGDIMTALKLRLARETDITYPHAFAASTCPEPV